MLQRYIVESADMTPVSMRKDDAGPLYLASEVDQQLAFANDAAAKGEAARLAAAGMEARIDDLERALRSATLALIKKRAADAQWAQAVDTAMAEANAVLGSPTS